jgi:NAD(P)-dependent dehydrogenase (short-subunit alcohol dehydrogenase family)
MKIEGSKILVTGASSGIGAALAPMLAERGATVGIVARRRERLEEVLEQCLEHSPGSRLWATDLGDVDAAVGVVLEAWDAFGHLDVLVNNAAIPKRTPVQRLTTDDVDHVMRVTSRRPST